MNHNLASSSQNTPCHGNESFGTRRFLPLYPRDTIPRSRPSQPLTGAVVRSAAELHADDSPKFRQLPCRTFISVGTCPYRERCVYLHDPRLMCRDSTTKSRKKNNEDLVQDSLFWPTLPFHVVNQRVDNNRQPHVIQRYHVPSPRNDQYCRHDQAVYSMWMHFVIFCSMEVENLNSHRHAVAEIAAFAHPGYKYPLESSDSMILPSSSSKDHQSKNLHTGHQQCFFYKGTLAVNPFTNVSRLDVFKNLSCGEGSQLLFSTRESTSCSPSVSSKCPTTWKSSPSQVSLDGPSQVSLDGRALPQRAYAFPRNHLQPHFSSEDLRILNPHHGNYQPLHFDDTFTPCKFKNLLQHMGKDIEDHNFTVQHSNFLPVTSHSYFNEKAGAVSAMGLGCKAIHVNRIVHSRVDHLTSFTGARAIPKSSFLSHSEERKPFEWEMGKITDLKAGQCTFNMVKKGSFDTDEELKRSLYDLIDVKETSPSLDISRISHGEDNIALSDRCLAGNYFNLSPVADRTPEIKSPVNFGMASPTNISNVVSYSPSSVSSILRGSTKNIQSMDFNSCHRRQVHGNQEQLRILLSQYHTQSERISDQSTCRSQM